MAAITAKDAVPITLKPSLHKRKRHHEKKEAKKALLAKQALLAPSVDLWAGSLIQVQQDKNKQIAMKKSGSANRVKMVHKLPLTAQDRQRNLKKNLQKLRKLDAAGKKRASSEKAAFAALRASLGIAKKKKHR